MPTDFHFKEIPRTRIATFDVFAVALKKHHVVAMLEFDVTDSRAKLREFRKGGINMSFNAWLIKVVANLLNDQPEASAFLYNKKKLILFNDINVSMIVEKRFGDTRVPMPLVIEKANRKSAFEITGEIERAKGQEMTSGDIVLQKKRANYERLYYHLPRFIRRLFWNILLMNPKWAYRTMGNVGVTSVGMMGKINGWFIHRSVHPVSFGIGSVLKKPTVLNNEVKVREILNMTILVDHDVIDGAPMVRFLNDLTFCIETGKLIDENSV